VGEEARAHKREGGGWRGGGGGGRRNDELVSNNNPPHTARPPSKQHHHAHHSCISVSSLTSAQEKQRCPSHKNKMTAKSTKVARSLQRGQRLLVRLLLQMQTFPHRIKTKPPRSLSSRPSKPPYDGVVRAHWDAGAILFEATKETCKSNGPPVFKCPKRHTIPGPSTDRHVDGPHQKAHQRLYNKAHSKRKHTPFCFVLCSYILAFSKRARCSSFVIMARSLPFTILL